MDHRGRTEIAEFYGIKVKVFKSGLFKGITHIIQDGDTVALNERDIDELMIALIKAKQEIKNV